MSSHRATLSLQAAIHHLAHFCAVMPNTSHVEHVPLYDIDPPDLPENWHSSGQNLPQYNGPWGCTVTLPKLLPPHLRSFSVEKEYRSKKLAHCHVALKAYSALYEAELLNENLLPFSSFLEPDLREEVKNMLKNIEKRAGTTLVSVQMDPWAPIDESRRWYTTEISIAGLPALHMLTRTLPEVLQDGEMPTLFYPNRQPIKVEIRPLGAFHRSDECIERAQQYTRQIFWASYGARMKWNDLNFCYLFLPLPGVGIDQSEWDIRRQWSRDKNSSGGNSKSDGSCHANAKDFGIHFAFPTDLTVIRNGDQRSKAFRFVRWRHNPMSGDEEEELRGRYGSRFKDLEISYPLLEVEAVPKRMNLLQPLPPSTNTPPRTFLLIPKYSTVDLLSADDAAYAIFLPSVLRFMSITITVTSLRKELLSSSPLSDIPLPLLTTAITTPASQKSANYQRLETLGDTVLKFMTGIQLLSQYRLWHEGYLTKKKDHAVANVRLAKEAVSRGLYHWIIRDRMVVRKWKPQYFRHEIATPLPPVKENDSQQKYSTKVLADVVESLIGAAYVHGGFDLAIDCCKMFGLGLIWQTLPARIEDILAQQEPLIDYPSQIGDVEEMVGYTFKRKVLLVEALSHASSQHDLPTISYERMEFLGDSVLDMVVTDYLYHAPGKEYSPGHLHLRKSALVNAHFLAFVCLRCSLTRDVPMPRPDSRGHISLTFEKHPIYLWQCLLHSSHRVLEDQKFTFSRFQKAEADIVKTLETDSVFPWAALSCLHAPKFLSDMVESIIGAVYLDSSGDMDVVRQVLRKLGILQVMERIVQDEVDVLHPVSRMSVWASRQQKSISYQIEKAKGNITCTVLVAGEEVVKEAHKYHGRRSEQEIVFVAAERAIKILHLRG
jgi:endoribonuclease Dicer